MCDADGQMYLGFISLKARGSWSQSSVIRSALRIFSLSSLTSSPLHRKNKVVNKYVDVLWHNCPLQKAIRK